jgi:hypothetical protein
VFLGVPVLAVGAWLLVRSAPSHAGGGRTGRIRLGAALTAATGVLAVSVGGQRTIAAWPLLVAAGVAAVAVAGRRLLPPGSWSARRGLPSVIAARGLVGAAFAAAEVYLPLLLTHGRGLSLARAGWVLTVGAVAWSGGSFLAARWAPLADETVRVRVGAVLLSAGIVGVATAGLPGVPLLVPLVSWAIAGLGIGIAFPTLSVLALGFASPGEEGQVSSALQLNDYLVQSTALAAGSVILGFAGVALLGGAERLVLAAGVLGLLALVPASRLRRP